MVNVDPRTVSLPQPVLAAGRPHIELSDPNWAECVSPVQRLRPPGGPATFDTTPLAIAALGKADLVGDPTDAIAGWRLGWIQLQFIEDNFARYRGRSEREGSVLVNMSHNTLCRDNDTRGPPDIPANRQSPYYDHPDPALRTYGNGRGAFTVDSTSALVAPAPTGPARPGRPTGRFSMSSGFGDAPGSAYPKKVRLPGTRVDFFLHHVYVAYHFCTLLVVERASPGNRDGSWDRRNYTVLRHFYWNIRWDEHFAPNAAGAPTRVGGSDHCQLNLQPHVQNDMPKDPRFNGRQLERGLPISDFASGSSLRIQRSADWGDQWVGRPIVATLDSLVSP